MLNCVNGHGPLNKINNHGIEIDYCPVCGGVWLDHGELEKLLEMTRQQYKTTTHMAPNLDFSNNSDNHTQSTPNTSHHQNKPNISNHNPHNHKKKKEGFLDEVFDFDFF